MTARILVVDDVVPNLKLLEARLTAEYFDVTTATDGMEALAVCARDDCDIVLLDVMMPGMDGFEVCRRLKKNPLTAHIPVVMVTALDQPADRLKGLEVGADDFLTKPIDEVALIARVRSLARLKMVLDELRTRASTSVSLGMPDPLAHALAEDGLGGRLLLVDDRAASADQVVFALRDKYLVEVEKDPQEALVQAIGGVSADHGGLEESLRHQVRKTPVRRGRVRVRGHGEREVPLRLLARNVDGVLARSQQLDDA